MAAFLVCADLSRGDEEAASALYHAAVSLTLLGRCEDAVAACAAGMVRHAGLAELPWLAAVASWEAGRPEQAAHWARLAIALGNYAGSEGKKKRKKKGKGGGRGFSRLQCGTAQLFSVEEGGTGSGTSQCPANTLAISGSYLLVNDACWVVLTGPVDADFSAWQVSISCPVGEQSQNNGVAAICIS